MTKAADLTPRDVYTRLKAGDIAPLYLFVGPERLLVDRVVVQLKQQVLTGAFAEMNFLALTAKDKPIGEVLDACLTAPAFAERRLVILSDLLPAKKKSDEEALLAYATDPNPTTTLVVTGEKIDGRSKLLTTVRKTGIVVRFDAMDAREVPAWITKEARRIGITVNRGAATLLTELVGTDLGLLAQELEKLRLLVGAKGTVKESDVESMTADVKISSIFDLIRAIERRDASEALDHWKRVVAGKGTVPYAISMLAGQFRLIWQARVLLDEGAHPTSLGGPLKRHGWVLKKVTEQARAWNRADLERVGQRLLEVDILSKSARVPANVHMDALILDLTARR